MEGGVDVGVGVRVFGFYGWVDVLHVRSLVESVHDLKLVYLQMPW